MPSGTSSRTDVLISYRFYVEIDGITEAIFQEVQRLDQQASQFIGGERLEAMLAGAAANGDGDCDVLFPHETVVESMPVPYTATQAALPIAAASANHNDDGAPMAVALTSDPPDGVSGNHGGNANGNGIARVTRVTTPSTSSGGRSWTELASELQQLKDLRRRGQHGRGATNGKANGHAAQHGGNTTPSLWSEHAGIAAATLWEASTPGPLATSPDDHRATSRPESGSTDDESAVGVPDLPRSATLWE